jgi:PAS domain S-box-containing protein
VNSPKRKTIGRIIPFGGANEQPARKRTLRRQEQQYRLLFQTNPNPMWVFDVKSLRILAINEAAIALYDYSNEEFLKLRLTDLRRPEERSALIKALTGPNRPAHFSGQFQHVRKDSSTITVEIYSSPLMWDGIRARMVTAIDVTHRRRAEERLREQAEIIDRAQEAIVIRNVDDRRIMFWNKGAERLFGWSAEEQLGQSEVKTLVDPGQLDEITNALQTTGEFRGEVKQVSKDGSELITNVRATLVPDDEGKPSSVLIISSDITEQKKLEMQLLHAQRLESIGTLASGVAHDLNNMLTPILMCATLLREQQAEEEGDKLIELIELSAHRGAKLVNQVLTFARGIEGEHVVLQTAHLLNDVANIATQTFPKNIQVRTTYHEDVRTVEGDATQLHQVLLNLCVNARDAMPEGGTLTLGAENFTVDPSFAATMPSASPGPHVLLSVSDNGAGIPREILNKIFDPFFTTKPAGKGTGLGLSTVIGIVKSHGGFVNVYSEPGVGTTFKVFLPCTPDADAPSATPRDQQVPRGKGETILVVDDEEAIRCVTETMLSQHNYNVLTASDGPDALAVFALRRRDVQVVLTDLSMPYMDGVTLAHTLKRMKPDVQVIASTGRGDDADTNELAAAGIAARLAKPYNTRELLEILHQLVARH